MKQTFRRVYKQIRNYHHLDTVALAAGLLIYAAIVLSTASIWSIWFDEAYSAYIIRYGLVDIAHYTALDVHPPMYYWVLKGWTSVFGTSELGLRSLSLVFGMTAITFGFLIMKKLFKRRVAWISLLFLILSPMLIRYGQEARMYTMAAAIVMAGTYTLLIAQKSKKRLPWVVYGLLVSLGMWTHYFTAVAWLAHWAWRAVVVWQKKHRGLKYFTYFFTREWVGAHVLAVALFTPWMPSMYAQLIDIQTGWFWIDPISADSLTGYLTTILFFMDHDQTSPWIGLLFIIVIVTLLATAITAYRRVSDETRRSYLLITSLAIVPVILVFLASLPPLRSSFLERYLMPAVVSFSLLSGMVIALGTAKLKRFFQLGAIVIIAGSLVIGIMETQRLGNFNKNSGVSIKTNEVMAGIAARASDGEPIISRTPWLFYEAVFYESQNHPVYYLSDGVTGRTSGSLDMLQGNDSHKIIDLKAFTAAHPTVWYFGELGDNEIPAPYPGLKMLQSFRIDDPITGKKRYQAAQFSTSL